MFLICFKSFFLRFKSSVSIWNFPYGHIRPIPKHYRGTLITYDLQTQFCGLPLVWVCFPPFPVFPCSVTFPSTWQFPPGHTLYPSFTYNQAICLPLVWACFPPVPVFPCSVTFPSTCLFPAGTPLFPAPSLMLAPDQ